METVMIENLIDYTSDRRGFASKYNAKYSGLDCVLDYQDNLALSVSDKAITVGAGILSLQGHLIRLDKPVEFDASQIFRSAGPRSILISLVAIFEKDGDGKGNDKLTLELRKQPFTNTILPCNTYVKEDILADGKKYEQSLIEIFTSVSNSVHKFSTTQLDYIGTPIIPIVGANVFPHKLTDSISRVGRDLYEVEIEVDINASMTQKKNSIYSGRPYTTTYAGLLRTPLGNGFYLISNEIVKINKEDFIDIDYQVEVKSIDQGTLDKVLVTLPVNFTKLELTLNRKGYDLKLDLYIAMIVQGINVSVINAKQTMKIKCLFEYKSGFSIED